MDFSNWYTDTVDILRTDPVQSGNLTKQERKAIAEKVPCRVYSTQIAGPSMGANAARMRSTEKLACAVSVDIKAGDELHVVRGGNLGKTGLHERYFAGNPQDFYDPVGGALTGLEHKEVGLLMDEIVR